MALEVKESRARTQTRQMPEGKRPRRTRRVPSSSLAARGRDAGSAQSARSATPWTSSGAASAASGSVAPAASTTTRGDPSAADVIGHQMAPRRCAPRGGRGESAGRRLPLLSPAGGEDSCRRHPTTASRGAPSRGAAQRARSRRPPRASGGGPDDQLSVRPLRLRASAPSRGSRQERCRTRTRTMSCTVSTEDNRVCIITEHGLCSPLSFRVMWHNIKREDKGRVRIKNRTEHRAGQTGRGASAEAPRTSVAVHVTHYIVMLYTMLCTMRG